MKMAKQIGFWLLLSFILLLFLFPLLLDFLTSLKTEGDVASFPPKWVFSPTLEHYHNVFSGAGYPFAQFFLNSFFIAAGTSAITVIVCMPAAYAMVRYGVGLRKFFSFIVSLKLLPPIVFAIPYFAMYQFIGLLDTKLGLIWVAVIMNVPLTLMLMVGFIQELPVEIEEAALIDGCSPGSILLRIVFPLLAPGIAAAAILTFIFTWNEFLFVRILSDMNAMTTTVGSTLFIQAYGIRWGDIAAAIALSVLPPLLFTFFVQRYLVKGLSMGAVKG
ncbi:carbohydrate ABC transporter permease [Brevibacillus choshinensis]|uniref:Carbohydrate ABC transporter permease n=1 Tax=Brevibacillus choshinensis TaxID=54911 RepID=A0ABX7FWA6_BRECH|nr:carbohydrate ABC transporter permease [Brevibacillus choshinensis]QRG70175.1 carbohydrate ABC transporter permease [Brevibacillus choshinensis]